MSANAKPIGCLFYLIGFGFSIPCLVIWVRHLIEWLEHVVAGIIIGIALSPGFLLFPLIHWIIDKEFPWTYFMLSLCCLFFSYVGKWFITAP